MPKIKLRLSATAIEEAIKEIEEYKKEILQQKVSQLIQALTDFGLEVAKTQIREMGAVYTAELLNSTEGVFDPSRNVGFIIAGAPHAIYVEFGTGIVGANSPHPDPVGWTYDINNHGDKGWFYFNSNDGKWHHTLGMESRPFMYNTAKIIESQYLDIARELFSK